MKMKKKDILITGKLAGNAKIFATKLRNFQFSFTILDTGLGYSSSLPKDVEEELRIHTVKMSELSYFSLAFLISNHKLIVDFGGDYLKLFFKYIYLHKIMRKPIIEFHTGADIKELSVDKGLLPFLYRYFLRNVDINFTTPEMISIRNIVKLRLRNAVLYKNFPYYNTKRRNILLRKDIEIKEVKILHPSHLDWMENDYFEGRNTIKGNDKFLVAVKRLIESGYKNFKITLLKRGPDKDKAIKFIKDNHMEEYFIIKEHMERERLFKEMENSHLLVNAFSGGALGGIAMEALSMGLPVMSRIGYIGRIFYYGEDCPVLSCFTIEEIFDCLREILENPSLLKHIAVKSYDWFNKNINTKESLYPFILYYSILTGDDRFPEDEFENEINKRKTYKNFLNYELRK